MFYLNINKTILEKKLEVLGYWHQKFSNVKPNQMTLNPHIFHTSKILTEK